MSITFLDHKQIDISQWNALLSYTPDGRIFSRFEYLSAVHPNWSALIEERDGQYISAFPFPIKKKMGLNYLVQPVLIQQLQILCKQGVVSAGFAKELVNRFRGYASLRLSINSFSENITNKDSQITSIPRQTMVLDLIKGKDYYSDFSTNHKRNIKKASSSSFKIEKSNDFSGLLEGYRKYKAQQIGISSNFMNAYKRLESFLEQEDSVYVLSAISEDNSIHASGLFAGYDDVMTFLLSFSDDIGKKNGMMHAIIDHWLKEYSNEYSKLDFEGGNIDSLARFYGGFGAEPMSFQYIQKHRFPFNLYFR